MKTNATRASDARPVGSPKQLPTSSASGALTAFNEGDESMGMREAGYKPGLAPFQAPAEEKESRKDDFPRSHLYLLRFLGNVILADGCWVYGGQKNRQGYGQYAGKKAHRLMYEIFVGPIPDGLVIDHLCRNTSCVNFSHLEPVTQRINTLRGINHVALQAKQASCKRGHPFDQDNTRIYRGRRTCRKCCVIRDRASREGRQRA